jgi:NADH-quinone oxidoreductase subunit J
MTGLFFTAAGVAVLSTALAITRVHVVHALLYLIVSLLAVAVVFYQLGAPFIAAVEVIIYAGAIVVMFVFVVMLLNLGPQALAEEKRWLRSRSFLGPGALAAVLLVELGYALWQARSPAVAATVGAERVAAQLFSAYAIAVELASLLLLSALVGAHHLGRRG